MKRHREAGSVVDTDVEQEQKRMKECIAASGYAPRDIFNMDETGLFYA